MVNSNDKIDLSVVIPLYDEAENLSPLFARLREELGKLDLNWEVIFVDDGSDDDSLARLREIKAASDRVKIIQFRRNFGKSAALSAGFKLVRGDKVVIMDADLQDDPEEMPAFIAKLEEGYDLVSGWKYKRRDPLSKRLPSKLFNLVTSLFSGLRLHDFNCGLKIYRREVVKEIQMYGERHRFIPVLAHMSGFRVGELPVKHHPRRHGRSKFGAYRFIAGFFDLITLMFRMKFLTKPLHFFGSLGMLSMLVGLAILAYLTIGWFHGRWIGNRPLLHIGVLGVVAGVQLFTLGLIGEMIAEKSTRGRLPLREDSDIDEKP